MRLAIDARELEGRPTGVGRYLSNLLRHWPLKGPGLDVVLYTRFPIEPPAHTRVVTLRARSGTTWLWGALSHQLCLDRPDLFFGPAYALPWTNVPCAVTLHDLSFEIMPRAFPARDRLRRRLLARMAAQRASLILCMSRSGRDDIVAQYGPSALPAVVPLGVDSLFFGPAEASRVEKLRAALQCDGPVIGFSGSIFNRRHPEALLAACSTVFRRLRGGTLLIAGENRTYPHVDIGAIAVQLGIAQSVRQLSYVSDLDLRAVLALLDLFVWPSDYEGFGLPPLEAMAAGIPVVSTRVGSLAENLEDAALLVDSNTPEALAQAMGSLLSNPDLARRQAEIGRIRAATFAWETCAKTTLQLIQSTLPRS